ncbi:MAG: hypothetical protein FD124_1154 [Alphaproteobacteria bacterium]|nr:MAG: hypothetical protein FD160_1846 [Caulobacteraceae bacterium]TPW07402.1 MAG: hypothetical protein FD124_1154 [Alphaproteobacteria bacterium]
MARASSVAFSCPSLSPPICATHTRNDVLIDALLEAKLSLSRMTLEKMPKKEVLERTRRAFKGSSWMSEPLRTGGGAAEKAAIVAAQ